MNPLSPPHCQVAPSIQRVLLWRRTTAIGAAMIPPPPRYLQTQLSRLVPIHQSSGSQTLKRPRDEPLSALSSRKKTTFQSLYLHGHLAWQALPIIVIYPPLQEALPTSDKPSSKPSHVSETPPITVDNSSSKTSVTSKGPSPWPGNLEGDIVNNHMLMKLPLSRRSIEYRGPPPRHLHHRRQILGQTHTFQLKDAPPVPIRGPEPWMSELICPHSTEPEDAAGRKRLEYSWGEWHHQW
jgi:hypothetical protein